MLTQERLKELLSYDPETGLFTWKTRTAKCIHVGDIAGYFNNKGYNVIVLLNESYLAHRLAWLYMTGLNTEFQIDHINNIKSDNRFINLREATNAENIRNQGFRSTNKSGYIGVSKNKKVNKWVAQCCLNGKNYNLGYFENAYDAAIAYQNFAKKHHGEFYFQVVL